MNYSTPSTSQTITADQAAADVLLATIIDDTVDFLCAPDPDMAICIEALIEVANELRARSGTRPLSDAEVAIAAKAVIQ